MLISRKLAGSKMIGSLNLQVDWRLILGFLFTVAPLVAEGLGATDCDNITNITATRISASSVLVNWRYVPTNVLMLSQFVIEVFENESATPQQNYSTFSDGGNHSFYIENLVTSSQHLCFAVRLWGPFLTTSPSSGDMAEMDECPRGCLPLSPQVPGVPEGFVAMNATNSSSDVIIFSWNMTEGSVLLSCRSGSQVPTIIGEYCGGCSPVHVSGFEHSTQYNCTLSEKAGVIFGPSNSISFQTDVDRLAPPDFTTSVTSTSILVRFSRPGLLYRISIFPNGLFTLSEKFEESLLGLQPSTTYEIEVTVRMSILQDWSRPSSKTVTTLPEAPGKINSITGHVESGSMAIVSWLPPDNNSGFITAYRYCWAQQATIGNQGERCVNTIGNTTTATVSLSAGAGTVYAVRVAAFTDGGRGPFSDHIYLHIPGAAVPSPGYTIDIGNRSDFIQLKFRGINNCSLWEEYTQQRSSNSANIIDDITNDLSSQLSSLCNCNLYLPQLTTNRSVQCGSNVESNEVLFQAMLLSSSSGSCNLRQCLENWFVTPSPHVRVSNQNHLLLLDRTCTLYSKSLNDRDCLDDTDTDRGSIASNSGGAVAGALIGGIILGAVLAAGIGLGIVLFLWYRQRRRGNVKIMKKVDPDSDFPLSTRYIPQEKGVQLQSSDNYEPLTTYYGESDSKDPDSYYEPCDIIGARHQPAHAKGKKSNHKLKGGQKGSSSTHASSDNKAGNVIEDDSGYVVPDVLWEGKKRPQKPTAQAKAQPSAKQATSTAAAPAAQATTPKVEYDIPEGVDKASKQQSSSKNTQNRSKGSGQVKEKSQLTSAVGRQESVQQPVADSHVQAKDIGKGRQKQKPQQVPPQHPSITALHQTQQQQQKVGKEPQKSTQGGKLAKKGKPKQQREISSQQPTPKQLSQQTAPSTTTFTLPTAAKSKSHDAVKHKLQNVLAPAAAPTKVAGHAPLTRQISNSANEMKKVEDTGQASKVKAMAQFLEGGNSKADSSGAGSATSDSTSVGPETKKKPILPKAGGTLPPGSQGSQQASPSSAAPEGKTSSATLPLKKPKPAGKGTANIALKSNQAYNKWSKEKDAVHQPSTSNPRGGDRGNQNFYHL